MHCACLRARTQPLTLANLLGKWVPVLAFKEVARVFRTQTGEHAAFWFTVFYWTRADGQVYIPPYVVHQGEEMSAFFAMHLPEDWGVHCTASGYMDQVGWIKVCKHFLRYCGRPAGSMRPLFTYIDGAEGHWATEGLRLLLEQHVYVRFLRSHASEDDQPNDNGPNALWHSCYGTHFTHWQEKYGVTVKFTPAFANMVAVAAWNDFKSKAGPVVVKAFMKTGIFPLSSAAENHVRGANKLALPFLTPPPAAASAAVAPPPPLPAAAPEPEEGSHEWFKQRCTALAAENAALQQQLARGSLVLTFAAPAPLAPPGGSGAPLAAPLALSPELLIRTAAWTAMNASVLKPTQEITAELEAHRRAKGSKPRKGPHPDTTRGCIVTSELLEECNAADAERAAAAGEKERNAVKRKAEASERLAKRTCAGSALATKLLACETPEARQRAALALKVEELCDVITFWGGSVKDTATKKPLLQPALRAELRRILQEAPAGPAGAGAEAPAGAAA